MGCQGVRTGDGKLSNVGRDYGVDRVFDGEWADWWVETFEQDETNQLSARCMRTLDSKLDSL